MVDPEGFLQRLEALDVRFATGVPDSLLKEFGQCLMATWPRQRHIIAANEGNAVALAMGHFLATGRPALVYLQNSGLGNTVNPLLSLADPEVYGIPMVLLVGWRGQPGVPDEPQHVKQGRIMPQLLDALELPWEVLPADEEGAHAALARSVEVALSRSTPTVLLVEKGTFSRADMVDSDAVAGQHGLATREDALAVLASEVGDDAIYIGTTGMLSRELFEHRQAGIGSGDRDLLSVGGMGHASSMALGIALAVPGQEVWCLDGDGALLMHLGALPVIAESEPANLFHVVVNNAVHDSVGGQPTAIEGVDIPLLARSAGYRFAESVRDLEAIPDAVDRLRERGGPALLEVRVRPGNRPDLGRPTRSPRESRELFMRTLSVDDLTRD